jgi:hypothetical protein
MTELQVERASRFMNSHYEAHIFKPAKSPHIRTGGRTTSACS